MANSKTVTGEFRTKVYFAHVQQPSQYGHFEVNIAVTPEIEKTLIDLQLDKKIKAGKEQINDGGKYLTLRNAALDLKGFESEMIVIDQNGKKTTELIGNGSECIVYWRSYTMPKYGKVIKFGKMLEFNEEDKKKKFGAMKVLELISYNAKPNEFADALGEEDPFPKSADLKTKAASFEIEA